MNVIAWILGIVLAGVFGPIGIAKVLDFDRMRDHFGYSKRQYQLVGLSEIAGAAGVIVGVAITKVEWIGLAAAVGLAIVLLGALVAHARVEDEGKKIIPPMVMLAVLIAYVCFVSLR